MSRIRGEVFDVNLGEKVHLLGQGNVCSRCGLAFDAGAGRPGDRVVKSTFADRFGTWRTSRQPNCGAAVSMRERIQRAAA